MPASHRRYLEWTPSRILSWARSVGPATAELVETVLNRRPHPEQGFRSCLGIFHLSKEYDSQRIEAACAKAIVLGAYSYRSVQSILEKNLDGVRTETLPQAPVTTRHENVRGAEYYIQGDGE